jgi:long-chain acyl-CoA synthetase
MLDHFDAAWNELVAPGTGFAMETIEVRGVPMRVFGAVPPTMRSVWELAQLHGDKTYLVYEDERYTYAEVAARVRALAHWLRDEHGVGPGDRVAVAMRNYPEWVVSYWAVAALGAALVGINAWWTPKELAYGLSDSRPKVLIADDERVERFVQVLDQVRGDNPDLHLVSVRSDRELPDGRTGRASRCADRSRRRRHDLLHLGHDRLPQGRPAHPPWLGAQPLRHRVHDDGGGRRRGQGGRRR